MKKILCVGLLLLSWYVSSAQEVSIGVFVHAPHVYKNEKNDEVYGSAVDYIAKIVKSMGYKPKFHLLPLPRILLYLKTGKLDMTLEIIKTPEREEYLYYSDKPTYIMVPSLTFLATNNLNEINSVTDLGKIKIGYLKGAITSSFFKDAVNIEFDSVSGDDWIKQNLAKLLAGRIDAAMDNNAYSYWEEARKQRVAHKIKIINIPGERTNYYVVFSKASSKGHDLFTKYNSLFETGQYNEQQMIDDFINK
jgi:polar amino acid transport system substrate-binding protein